MYNIIKDVLNKNEYKLEDMLRSEERRVGKEW